MILEKPHIYSPITGTCKQHALWANDKDRKSCIFPLIYFQKPKWISKERFDRLIKQISIEMPKEIELEYNPKE